MARITITRDPFVDMSRAWPERGDWAASWVDHPQRPLDEPSVVVFRLKFEVNRPGTARLHVSADNRYYLLLDGQPLGRGPHRGDPLHWPFDSYEVELGAGRHTLVALSWWMADIAPYAQMTVRPGFLLAAEGDWHPLLSTGAAAWEAALVPGVEFTTEYTGFATGARIHIDGRAFPWGWEHGEVEDFRPVTTIVQGMAAGVKNEIPPYWLLTPTTLPAMMEQERQVGRVRYLVEADDPYPVRSARHLAEEAARWDEMLAGRGAVTIPPHTTRTAVIDLQDYYCAYPLLVTSGGAGGSVHLRWAEALYEAPQGHHKGNRGEIEGKYFRGAGDRFTLDGGRRRRYRPLWWQAGRYVEVTVTTKQEPVTIEALKLLETRYPLEMESRFSCSDERLGRVIPIALRGLQMCAHETYMDCPYYEQLMYVGDTRLEVLATYAITGDDRLPRKAIAVFDASRRLSGFTQSRFPSRITQIIPPFSLWWVGMVYDYWLWRDDESFVQAMMPGVRAVMEAFRSLVGAEGLMAAPNGWNYTDWVPGWSRGIPPDADLGISSILNLQFALVLGQKAEMEEAFGETDLAHRDREMARSITDAVLQHFWQEDRGLIADNMAGDSFSEHAQCLALLGGLLPEDIRCRVAEGLLTAPDLARTTIYFTHYLFETYYLLGRGDKIIERLGLWFDLEANGFKTTLEEPEPSRSDCHGWGAHPLHHYFASLLGIRPAAAGFRRVRIAPRLGPLQWIEGTMPHPRGEISAGLRREGERLAARLVLPAGVSGTFAWQGQQRELQPGVNEFTI